MARVYRRRLELLYAGVVHNEQWDVTVYFDVRHQSEPAIIEDHPGSVETSGNNGVILAGGQIAHHDKPYVILGNARRPKRDVFCNCIIFTIAAAGRECRERCAPAIDYLCVPKMSSVLPNLGFRHTQSVAAGDVTL
jgi:hypothetical protein